MRIGLFEDVFMRVEPAVQGILPFLSSKDICNLSRTTKSIQYTVTKYFDGEMLRIEKIFLKIDFRKSDDKSGQKNLTNFTNFLKEKIFSYPDSQVPSEIRVIINKKNLLTFDEVKQLANFIEARDVLVVWDKLCRVIEVQEDFSQVFDHCNVVITKAKLFENWLTEQLKLLLQIQEFDLSNNQLTYFPLGLGRLANLQKLHLDRNQFTSIPKNLEKLSNLKFLHLGQNQITSISKRLDKLIDLDWLYLEHNQLISVEGLGNLTKLKVLLLEYNQLKSIPVEFEKLSELKYLDLYGNQLTSVPVQLGKLADLRQFHIEVQPLLRFFISCFLNSIFQNITAAAVSAYAYTFRFFCLSASS